MLLRACRRAAAWRLRPFPVHRSPPPRRPAAPCPPLRRARSRRPLPQSRCGLLVAALAQRGGRAGPAGGGRPEQAPAGLPGRGAGAGAASPCSDDPSRVWVSPWSPVKGCVRSAPWRGGLLLGEMVFEQ